MTRHCKLQWRGLPSNQKRSKASRGVVRLAAKTPKITAREWMQHESSNKVNSATAADNHLLQCHVFVQHALWQDVASCNRGETWPAVSWGVVRLKNAKIYS